MTGVPGSCGASSCGCCQLVDSLREVLSKMLEVDGDHMTACNRTMGATHPCTCGANDARLLLK